VTLPQIVKRLNSSPVLKTELDKALGDGIAIEGIKGSEVPAWLGRQIGKSPTIKTLRRWAKKYNLEFSSHLPVPPKTLDTFLRIA
jgi:nicotinic acid mononucleotide adenylyltransferase